MNGKHEKGKPLSVLKSQTILVSFGPKTAPAAEMGNETMIYSVTYFKAYLVQD